MIRTVMTNNRVTIEGHADFAPRGEDIVCAAVSALVYALIAALEEKQQIREMVIRPGYVTVAAKDASCKAEFAMLYGGLGQLAARYPQCVKVE